MLFLPNDDKLAALAKTVVEDVVKAEGRCHIVGWRDVPVVKEVVGRQAAAVQPRIVQVRHPAHGCFAVLGFGLDPNREFCLACTTCLSLLTE